MPLATVAGAGHHQGSIPLSLRVTEEPINERGIEGSPGPQLLASTKEDDEFPPGPQLLASTKEDDEFPPGS